MSVYKTLTAYLPTLEADNFGKWITDSEGMLENPLQMPYVSYSRMARHFIDDVHTFADEHREYDLYSYNDILFENGIECDSDSMSKVDVAILDGKCITALLMGVIRADRFSEGALLHFFETGTITKWLNRLKEIDEKRVLTETNSQGSFFILS